MPQATSLAARIKDAKGAETTLIKGSSGAFEVTVDGEKIYSKLATGRFPEPEEILAKLPG